MSGATTHAIDKVPYETQKTVGSFRQIQAMGHRDPSTLNNGFRLGCLRAAQLTASGDNRPNGQDDTESHWECGG